MAPGTPTKYLTVIQVVQAKPIVKDGLINCERNFANFLLVITYLVSFGPAPVPFIIRNNLILRSYYLL